MIYLNLDQRTKILQLFLNAHETKEVDHATWSRREYNPRHIFQPFMTDVRKQIESTFPDHVIAFDVIFASKGAHVAWHCDYESLGPFDVPSFTRAIQESHFRSVHVNLTDDGGALCTLHTPAFLSQIVHKCIMHWGVFNPVHLLMTWLLWPVFVIFARVHSNRAGVGNTFDNLRLHSVGRGRFARISYVVRLVHKREVFVSQASLLNGVRRSHACASLCNSLSEIVASASGSSVQAGDIAWHEQTRT